MLDEDDKDTSLLTDQETERLRELANQSQANSKKSVID